MLAALLLGSWLAQAEPAPPDPGPPVWGPAQTTPTTPASPGAAGAPPVPSGGGSGAPEPARRPPRNTVTLLLGLGVRLGSEGGALGPRPGFSVGGSYERRYAALTPELELGAALEFLFDQFSQAAQGPTMPPSGDQLSFSRRTFSETTFAALQTAGVRAGRMRAHAGVGGGLAIGAFSSPEVALQPGSSHAYQPFARGVAGFDVELREGIALGLRAGYTFMLTAPSYTTTTGQVLHLFGDVLDIHAGLFYRFR
jgi:hypothetical protein